MTRKHTVSVIVPVFNEQGAVPLFLERCLPVLRAICAEQLGGGDFEVLFIDDGSRDDTARVVVEEAQREPHIRLVRFSRNFGKEAGLAAGFHYATGDAVIPMDVDLQDPPEVLPRMIDEWLRGAEMVNAIRRSRAGDSAMKRLTARLFYRLYNRVADQPIKPNVGDFRLLDRIVVDSLNRLSEGSRFTKGLYSWVGYRQIDIEYDRPERSGGETKWGYRKLVRFAFDGLIASTTAPLRIWSYVGLMIGLMAFLFAGFIVVRTLFFGVDVPGYASTMAAVLFLGGLNLLSLGIMGEYLGRMAQEVRHRPLYVVRETIGLAPPPPPAPVQSPPSPERKA